MTVTTWSYDGGADSGTGLTSEGVQRSCQEKGGEFVPP
jgi:hypothetical protein